MSRSHDRVGPRAGALALAGIAALATGVALLPATPTSAAPAPAAAPAAAAYDDAPLAAGTAWITGQLTDGVIEGPYGANTGTTVDAGRALWTVGDDEAVASIVDGLEPLADSYTGDNGFGTLVSAGGSGKLASFLQLAGVDPSDYGGVDLVARLEGQVRTEGAHTGRVFDTFDPADEFGGDFANVFGQAYAAEALTAAGSELAAPVTDYLLDQQCADGGFRLYFSAESSEDPGCVAAGGEGSTDTTAVAVQALLDQSDAPEVDAAIEDAVGYLRARQNSAGGFDDGGEIGANANSTGLAGWTLGLLRDLDGNPYGIGGQPGAAAAWLRARQVDEVATCTTALSADQGAVAYDDAALATGRRDGIDEEIAYQWQGAGAQSLPALAYAPAATRDPGFRLNGIRHRVNATMGAYAEGLAPGESACLVGGARPVAANAGLGGSFSVGVPAPATQGVRNLHLGTSAGTLTLRYWTLGAHTFRSQHPSTVRVGGRVQVTVSSLAPYEPFTLAYGGRNRATGTANHLGQATFSFPASGTLGRNDFWVIGQFPDRFVKATYTVVR